MATANKVLGQSKPAAATPTTLYTVPASTQANVNVFISNQAAGNDMVRVALTKSGNSLAASNYLVYDTPIPPNSSLNLTGIALATGDFITIYCTSGNCSFNATGIEIS
jgi:flagella basal body P-ring formation protein FlgA